MTANNQQIPAGTLRTASIIVLVFAAVLLLFGQGMFRAGGSDSATAQELQDSGLQGTVMDARANVVRADDGEWHAMAVELTFAGSDGQEHTLQSNHFPSYHPPLDSTGGWVADFPTKDQIVGQPVAYRLGGRPAVELESELPALASDGWGMPNYLGLTLMVLGGGAAVGGVLGLRQAGRRRKIT
ncbi:hypothetical protein ACFUCV_13230 [Specibacter sp. NPDC057265]|uniref:hypothetical protein n=1 Tax=Specibacter sp. NPDC057265 TaxID=3346075 RepID=UPI00362E7F4F